MKRVILAGTTSNSVITVYHGDRRALNPKVANQKEIGLHFGSLDAAKLHGHYIVKTTLNVAGSNVVTVEDANDWASIEGLINIMSVVDPSLSADELTEMWRSWRVSRNSVEASRYIREMLVNDYGVTCLHYVDAYDIPGTDCYILLVDKGLKALDVSELYPNYEAAAREFSKATGLKVELQSSVRFGLIIKVGNGQSTMLDTRATLNRSVDEAYNDIQDIADNDEWVENYLQRGRK